MSPRSLVVVRGSYRGTDPTFACMAHDVQPKRYLMLEMEDGRVMDRHVVADRRAVEARMQDTSYRGVYVDMRTADTRFTVWLQFNDTTARPIWPAGGLEDVRDRIDVLTAGLAPAWVFFVVLRFPLVECIGSWVCGARVSFGL